MRGAPGLDPDSVPIDRRQAVFLGGIECGQHGRGIAAITGSVSPAVPDHGPSCERRSRELVASDAGLLASRSSADRRPQKTGKMKTRPRTRDPEHEAGADREPATPAIDVRRRKADHLAQQVGVGALPQQRAKSDHLVGMTTAVDK
jgi:hypothetical protein